MVIYITAAIAEVVAVVVGVATVSPVMLVITVLKVINGFTQELSSMVSECAGHVIFGSYI